jgi:hypothetical protein
MGKSVICSNVVIDKINMSKVYAHKAAQRDGGLTSPVVL